MKTSEWFKDEIRKNISTKKAPSEYGSKVMPVLELYRKLASFEERKEFQLALEELLRSDSEADRAFAVDVCLGFFIFRDAI